MFTCISLGIPDWSCVQSMCWSADQFVNWLWSQSELTYVVLGGTAHTPVALKYFNWSPATGAGTNPYAPFTDEDAPEKLLGLFVKSS